MSAFRAKVRPVVLALAALAAALSFAFAGATAASAGTVAEIKFAPGTNSAYVGGSVVRADADVYGADAYAGQVMTVDISSVEGNAVFTTYSPSGKVLCAEEFSSTIVLRESGTYVIVVSGTRGNATYDMTVAIV